MYPEKELFFFDESGLAHIQRLETSVVLKKCITDNKVVEFQDDSAILPDDWQVGSSTRDNAQLISKDASGNPRYGGTVSDSALIRYIEELHSRGYKVMLYPMPLLDTNNKEWRGRLSGAPEDISDFFKNQYNKFIEHYASIAKQTKVEGFIIGSEFAQLTKIRDEQGNYPAVIELVKLAKRIKLDLGKEVIVTYAADWSEYHSYDGWYNMDELWSSQYIDVVGIDAYFPLTDGPEPPFGYSAEDVMGGWNSGVGYDYFYDYSKSEPEKVNETHINPGGSKTKWQPKMKKIWFAEYRFPSMNGCTNEPNVFVDKGSIESKYPRYSNGEVSFLSQKIAIEGTLKKWQSSEMVEKMFLWAWDARPFPYFPNLCDMCHNWQTGHWIQGKLSQLNIPDVLSDLLQKAGLKSDQFDTGGVKGLLSGYVINDQQPVRSIIKMLQSCYFFDVVEQDSKLKFIQKGRAVTTGIPIGEMVFNNSSKSMQLVNISQLDLNNKVNIVYFNRNFGYPIDVKYGELPKQGTAITVEIPLIMEEGEAQNIAEVLLYSSWQERNIYNFKLPIKYAWLVPSDVITILDGEKKHTVRIIKTKFESMAIQVIGVGYDHSIYKLSFPSTRSLMLKEYPPSHISKTIIEMIVLPHIKGNIVSFTLIGEEKNWKGATLFISYNDKDYKPIASTNKQSTYGYVMESTDKGLIVVLRFGKLLGIIDSNSALIGKEIVKFQSTELIDKNKYKLSNLIRGQEGTKEYDHATGEKFILLDDSIISFEVQRGKKVLPKSSDLR
ncbi:hypothetical protein FQR65_LT17957 [Abscondita terminalis]|nr:hypothetical protein FQR65_LT17957 [Abscondita terminalis]